MYINLKSTRLTKTDTPSQILIFKKVTLILEVESANNTKANNDLRCSYTVVLIKILKYFELYPLFSTFHLHSTSSFKLYKVLIKRRTSRQLSYRDY